MPPRHYLYREAGRGVIWHFCQFRPSRGKPGWHTPACLWLKRGSSELDGL